MLLKNEMLNNSEVENIQEVRTVIIKLCKAYRNYIEQYRGNHFSITASDGKTIKFEMTDQDLLNILNFKLYRDSNNQLTFFNEFFQNPNLSDFDVLGEIAKDPEEFISFIKCNPYYMSALDFANIGSKSDSFEKFRNLFRQKFMMISLPSKKSKTIDNYYLIIKDPTHQDVYHTLGLTIKDPKQAEFSPRSVETVVGKACTKFFASQTITIPTTVIKNSHNLKWIKDNEIFDTIEAATNKEVMDFPFSCAFLKMNQTNYERMQERIQATYPNHYVRSQVLRRVNQFISYN